MDQKSLVRMLRHDLADCVTPDVLAAFRTVDFQKIRTVRAQQQHEKQSLDADPFVDKIYFYLGMAYLKNGDKKAACLHFRKSEELGDRMVTADLVRLCK